MYASSFADAAGLISAIAQLAWPVAVVVLVLGFRKTIVAQAGRLQALKAAGAELTFADRVDQVVRESGELADDVVDGVVAARRSLLVRLASEDPVAAIRKGWEVVREAGQAVARRRHREWRTTKDIAEWLAGEGLLDASAVRTIASLRSLRYDLEDHPAFEVTPTIATAYITAASNVADLLYKLEQA